MLLFVNWYLCHSTRTRDKDNIILQTNGNLDVTAGLFDAPHSHIISHVPQVGLWARHTTSVVHCLVKPFKCFHNNIMYGLHLSYLHNKCTVINDL